MMNKHSLSVLIVEDDKENLHAIESILEHDFTDIYMASNGVEGLELYYKHKPNIIVSDITMPFKNGLEMLQEIRETDKVTPIIFLSAHNEVSFLQDAIELKASSYIIKPFNYKELLEKIDLNLHVDKHTNQVQEILSQREYEIFLQIAKGFKPAQMAQKYNVKPKTISTYRNRILQKLNLTNNSDIVKLALHNNLV